MLSLLSLLLASGTVLRADTDEWTPDAYPDPRTNSTLCNTWANSTLCDPDHMLTDYWRQRINDNILAQIERLNEGNVQYTDRAPMSCLENRTAPVKIYVLLAKRIQTANNQTITEEDLTNFGNELTQRFGLNQMSCKNFLLLIGVEAAKLAYVRTGKDLKLPPDLMQRVFYKYNAFNAKNYMEGLNKIVDEIGTQMTDPFKDLEELIREYTAPPETKSAQSSTQALTLEEFSALNRTTTEHEPLIVVEGKATAEHTSAAIQQTPCYDSRLILMLMSAIVLLSIFALLTLTHFRRRSPLKASHDEHLASRRPTRRCRVFGDVKRLLRCSRKRRAGQLNSQQPRRSMDAESSEISSMGDSLEAISDRHPVRKPSVSFSV